MTNLEIINKIYGQEYLWSESALRRVEAVIEAVKDREREACASELLEAEYLLHDMMGANYYPDPIINQHGQNDPRSYVYANAAMYFAKKEEARLLLSENKEVRNDSNK